MSTITQCDYCGETIEGIPPYVVIHNYAKVGQGVSPSFDYCCSDCLHRKYSADAISPYVKKQLSAMYASRTRSPGLFEWWKERQA